MDLELGETRIFVTHRTVFPRVARAAERPWYVLGRIGDQALFYAKVMAGIPTALRYYRSEIVRLVAEISMGAGVLAMIGGTLVVVGFLTVATGGTLTQVDPASARNRPDRKHN